MRTTENMDHALQFDWRNEEIGALLDVNQAIGRHLERDRLFAALADCLKNVLPADHFGIELPIEDGKLQGHVLSRGANGQATESIILPAAGTACAWVLQNRESFVAASRDDLREQFPTTFEVMVERSLESL